MIQIKMQQRRLHLTKNSNHLKQMIPQFSLNLKNKTKTIKKTTKKPMKKQKKNLRKKKMKKISQRK